MTGPPLTAEIVLQSALTGGGFTCDNWNVASVRPAMISVVPTSDRGQPIFDAARLGAALKAMLFRLANSPERICHGPGPAHCRTHAQPSARCVLVIVGDGTPVIDYSGALAAWTARRHDPRYIVIPSCQTSTSAAFLAAIQPHFGLTKVFEWSRRPDETIPAILNAAGLTLRDYRVFISYYQADGRDHADDLQGALAARGFDVFLDRTNIAVGQDISDRIREEIAHKSVLMVLETPLVTNSRWVPKEVGTAIANRVGLLAVRFPRGGRTQLSDRRRETLGRSDLDRDGRLTPDALNKVCQRVSGLHDYWLIRRRYQMQRAMSRMLLDQGLVNHRLTPDGWLDVVPAWLPSTVCSIRTTPRVAELADFRDLDDAVAPPRWHRAVVAPGTGVAGSRQADMRWLSNRTETTLFDEADMRHVATVLADPTLSELK